MVEWIQLDFVYSAFTALGVSIANELVLLFLTSISQFIIVRLGDVAMGKGSYRKGIEL